MVKSEKELLNDIFKSNIKEIVSNPIRLSSDAEIVITLRPAARESDDEQWESLSEEEYYKEIDKRPAKSARAIFDTLLNESSIAFWLEMAKLIKEHCTEADGDNSAAGIPVPPEGHFRKMFNDVVREL